MAGFFGGVLGSGFPICALPPSFVSAGGGGSSVRSGIGASVQVSRRPESSGPGDPQASGMTSCPSSVSVPVVKSSGTPSSEKPCPVTERNCRPVARSGTMG